MVHSLKLILYAIQIELFENADLFFHIGISVFISAVWWLGCRFVWSRINNIEYRETVGCRYLFGYSSLTVMVYGMLVAGIYSAEHIAEDKIDNWSAVIREDHEWIDQTLLNAYDAVNALGVEHMTSYPRPTFGSQMPLSPLAEDESKKACAKIYASAIKKHFEESCPILTDILHSGNVEVAETIQKDMLKYFLQQRNILSNSINIFSLEEAIDICVKIIREEIVEPFDQNEPFAHRIIFIAFLLMQIWLLVFMVPRP